MTLEQLRRELRERVTSTRKFAALAGVSHMSVTRVMADGYMPNMRTFERLSAALKKHSKERP